jgi:hypothetical protein
MTDTTSDLYHLAAMSRKTWWISDTMAEEVLTRLTSAEAKKDFATKLIKEAQHIYAIPEHKVADLAEGFVDPATRRGAERSFHSFGFTNPKTQWAGTGYSLIMDAVYAEDEPLADCHIVAIPAQWSTKVWHSERDMGEDGYTYSHWVYAELPSITFWDFDTPVSCVLVSGDLVGSLYWGSNVVSLYRGEVQIHENAVSNFSQELAEFKTTIPTK